MLRSEAYRIILRNSKIKPALLDKLLDSFNFNKNIIKTMGYEISIAENSNEIGLQANLNYKKRINYEIFIQNQKQLIFKMISLLNKQFDSGFETCFLKRVFSQNTGKSTFFHFGFEILNNKLTRIKIYFVPARNVTPKYASPSNEGSFFDFFKVLSYTLNHKIQIPKWIETEKINAFGIDLYASGSIRLKIYRYRQIKTIKSKNIHFSKGDGDLLYSYLNDSLAPKITKAYIYPKPPLSIKDFINLNEANISNKIIDFLGDTALIKRIRITALAFDKKNKVQIYLN